MKITVNHTCPYCKAVHSEKLTPPVPAKPPYQMTCPTCHKKFTTSFAGYALPEFSGEALGGCLGFLLILGISSALVFGGADKNPKKVNDEYKPVASPSGMSRSQSEDVVKVGINLHGFLCADIVTAQPLGDGKRARVTCIKHQGRTEQVTYLVDIETGETTESN